MTAADGAADVSLSQFLEVVSRRRWVLALFWCLSIFISLLYIDLAAPVYEAKTLVELEKPGNNTLVQQGGMIIAGDDEEYLSTEFRRFKTDTLDQKVYDDLHLASTRDFGRAGGLKRLQDAITIVPLPHTHLAYVQVQSHVPADAVRISATLASYYVQDHINNALFMSRDVLRALQLDTEGGDKRRTYDALPSVVENKLIQSIKDQKVALEGQIADLSMRFTPKHPQVIAAKGRLEALDRILARETENIVDSLKAQLSGKLTANSVRVLDPARMPDAPIKPKKAVVLVIGVLGGLLLGLFAAAVADALDQSIRSEEDVERKIGEAFLGSVPRSRQKSGAKVYEAMLASNVSLSSEAFRNLRTMVDFAGVDGRASPLLVTSSVKEEGKSFVAANLAVAFAQAGARVLLIEGDLRRPTVHKKFGLSGERGLCDFLAGGTQADISHSIRPAGVPNLSVLVCGPRPPNPSELLNTPRVSALVAWAVRAYDRVVVDCAPLYPISDTLLWGRHVRSAVFVTRYGRTRAPLIRRACGKLTAGGIKTLGVVINDVRVGSPSYAGGYYEQYYIDYAQPTTAAVR